MGALLLLKPLNIRCDRSMRVDAKVDRDDVVMIRALRSKYGLSLRAIAEKFGISHEMVDRICKFKCYRDVKDGLVDESPKEPESKPDEPISEYVGFSAAVAHRMRNGVKERRSLRWAD